MMLLLIPALSVLWMPIISNGLLIEEELSLNPKHVHALATLEKVALLQNLNLSNLNNILEYYGVPQLNTYATEKLLNDYRTTLSQLIQSIKFSKFLLPNVYDQIVLVIGSPLNQTATFLQIHNVTNVNDLINGIDLSIRSIFKPFQVTNLRKSKTDLSLESKDLGTDFMWNFVFDSLKAIIDDQVKQIVLFVTTQVNTTVEGIVSSIKALDLKGFGLDVSTAVINILEVAANIIIDQLLAIETAINNFLNPYVSTK